MTAGGSASERQDGVIPSPVDPEYECVPAPPGAGEEHLATPPDPTQAPGTRRLCPDGYVPRRRKDYRLRGKLVERPGSTPSRNPSPPPTPPQPGSHDPRGR